jgi:hypothetical protein
MSEVAALIADMVRAGVSPELIGRTADALARREPVLVPDEVADRRRERDRERKRLRKSAEVGGTDGIEPSLEVSPTPLPNPNPSTHKENPPKGGQKKGSRLPDDFALPDDWRDWAVKRGLPPERVQIEFEKITNWAANAGAKGAKPNWFRAWQNWVISAIDALPRNRAGPPGPKPGSALEAAIKLKEQFDAVTPSPAPGNYPPPRLLAGVGNG